MASFCESGPSRSRLDSCHDLRLAAQSLPLDKIKKLNNTLELLSVRRLRSVIVVVETVELVISGGEFLAATSSFSLSPRLEPFSFICKSEADL